MLQERQVVIAGREVVGAEIDADDIGLIATKVPFLFEERRFLAQIQVEGIARIFVLNRHTTARRARLGLAIVAIGADAAASHHPVLSAEVAGGDGGVGIIVVLGLVFEVLIPVGTLVAIAAGDGVTDELDLP